jgi:predicted nucleotidyltransferase
VDLSAPLTALARRTDAAALSVLAAAREPLTGRQVARLAGESTAANIRSALLRLVDIGLVTSAARPDAVLYAANREHLIWPAVEIALRAREDLADRIRRLTEKHASLGTTVLLYGSVARGEADADSDVDLLVVQEPHATNRESFPDYLRDDVRTWTGNRAQIFDATPEEIRQMWQAKDPLIDSWLREGQHVAGIPLETRLESAP